MKKPTTAFSIDIQQKAQITEAFLLSEGWILKEQYPLYDVFEHSKNTDLKCSISLYGGFSISELHWVNKTVENNFSTNKNDLTIEDYRTIIRLLNLKI